jgi:hypothetical protein
MIGAVGVAATLVGCSRSPASVAPTTIAPTTTTSTTIPASSLTVVGVRPGVLQAPFYPQATVGQVSCGVAPNGGRFVRIDVPAGAAGTPAHSVLTNATAVIVVPGGAMLSDPRFLTRTLYSETMKSITTSTQGALVLTLQNVAATGGDGSPVEVGNVQVVGDYECPATDAAYPGT